MRTSRYLSSLNEEQRHQLHERLLERQGGLCFICNDAIDLVLHKGQLDVDHIDPLAEQGLDSENNFALTHASCNRSKGASNLRVARRLAEFDRLQKTAKESGNRGAHLGHVLAHHGGATAEFCIHDKGEYVEFAFPEAKNKAIQRAAIQKDT